MGMNKKIIFCIAGIKRKHIFATPFAEVERPKTKGSSKKMVA